MNINYEYYKTFYYVAKFGSITKAAEALYANQPNITRTINRLEELLSCKLFLRNHHGVTLTPEGELLYSHVSVAHEQLQLAESELADTTSLRTGTITIGTSETALNLYLLKYLKDFRDCHPGIRLRIINHLTTQAIPALKQGQIDFSIVTTPAAIDSSVSSTTLMTFQEILVCGKEYAELSRKKQHLRDIASAPLIMMSRGTVTYSFFNDFYLQHGLNMEIDTEAATADQIIPMVDHNLGLGFVPKQWAEPYLRSGQIFEIPLYESIPERSVVLLCNTSRGPGIAASEFIRYIQSRPLV